LAWAISRFLATKLLDQELEVIERPYLSVSIRESKDGGKYCGMVGVESSQILHAAGTIEVRRYIV
jgi:hypothetical protein